MARSVTPKFQGLTTIDAASKDFKVKEVGEIGFTDLALTTGDYFIERFAGEAPVQLIEEMEAKIQTAPGMGMATVRNSSAGRITIANPTNFSLTWTDVELRDILGFTGALAGANSYTGTNQHKYGWYPNVRESARPGDPTLGAVLTSDTIVTRSNAGTMTTTKYAEIYDDYFDFRYLDSKKVFPVSGSVKNESLQAFWQTILSTGIRFRYYDDATTALLRDTYVAKQRTAAQLFSDGQKEGDVERAVDEWTGMYKARLYVGRYV